MNDDIADDVNLVMQQVYYDETPGSQDSEPEEEVFHVHHFPDALVIIKEPGKSTTTNIPVVESTPKDSEDNGKTKPPLLIPYFVICAFLLLIFSTILFQIFLLIHPPTTTIIILLKSQTISLSDSIRTGRVIPPITLSQSQSAPATGRGHQDARAATGTITLYNGQLQTVTVPAGTILTGSDGVQVETSRDATIPPLDPGANPPAIGQITVPAHALNPGSRGNIPSFDISQVCCAESVVAKNTIPFHGGQDARNFQTVTQSDMNTLSSMLKSSLAQSMQGALDGQVKPNEDFQPLPCSLAISADHQAGQEAAVVKVTAIETCSGVAYSQNALQSVATGLLSHLAAKKLGSGFVLLGMIRLSVIQASVSHSAVIIAFSCSGTWVYALTHTAQEHLKHLIAGKQKLQAISILLHAPGIQAVSIAGADSNERLPKNPDLVIFQTFAQGA